MAANQRLATQRMLRAAAPAAAPLAIEVRGLRKRFRKYTVRGQYTTLKTSFVERVFRRRPRQTTYLQVLDAIDLEVPRGRALGVIGRNGSGKSTLLKLVAGILKPDEGTVRVEGRLSPLIELGAGFHPEFSGRENITLNGIVLGLSRSEIEERFDSIVDFAELRDFIDDPVRTYSSGMYMRLGFSIAVHASPDILLVDEILAVGDASFSKKCEDWIARFLRDGKTLLLVSHNLAAIEEWCDEAVWLDGGRIRRRGAPRDVVSRYREAVESGLRELDRSAPRGASIDGVRVFAAAEPGRTRFRLGEPIVVEIDYRVLEPVSSPVVSLAIRRGDGVCCVATSTARRQLLLPRAGKVKCRFPSLKLLDGDYTVDVAIEGREGPLDERLACAPFTFESDQGGRGVFRPEHDWTIEAS
jgi:ABC-type polysaccharide/polyol phosphate transport system ATPase subunit